ncbi:hypothetical protein WANA34_1070 [Wolbachia endosymbiont of Drosophila ananassae]|nr:hypothetical protein WANA34_1070 [Wolbachia endosymbiont of Drosophila ananassae]
MSLPSALLSLFSIKLLSYALLMFIDNKILFYQPTSYA